MGEANHLLRLGCQWRNVPWWGFEYAAGSEKENGPNAAPRPAVAPFSFSRPRTKGKLLPVA